HRHLTMACPMESASCVWRSRSLAPQALGGIRRKPAPLPQSSASRRVLAEFDSVRAVVQHPATVEAALWFHDVVYDPRSPTNEEDSAGVAVGCLNQAEVDEATIDL